MRAVGLGSGDRVLQVGAGTALVLREALRCGAERVVVLDPSAAAIARLAESPTVGSLDEGQIDLVCRELAPLPWPDGSFDAVVIPDLGEVLAFRAITLEEVRRVLVPGGRFAGCAGRSVLSFTSFG